MAFFRSVQTTLEMIKWEHSVFALPFALTGAMLAAHGWPSPMQLVWIVLCMVAARSAAMAFNRWADASLDAANPRTASRAIPAGKLTSGFVAGFTVVSSLLFLLSAAQLNRLTLWLSPFVLSLLLFYSYTKRITRYSHFILGLALGLAPSLAWIAVRGSFDARILVLTAAVLLWVGGFDLLYACQDESHDRRVGLKSLPASIGLAGTFRLARILHVLTVVLLFCTIRLFALGLPADVGLILVAILLLYEHVIISPADLRRLNAAFFVMNGLISVIFYLGVALDLSFRR